MQRLVEQKTNMSKKMMKVKQAYEIVVVASVVGAVVSEVVSEAALVASVAACPRR